MSDTVKLTRNEGVAVGAVLVGGGILFSQQSHVRDLQTKDFIVIGGTLLLLSGLGYFAGKWWNRGDEKKKN